MSQSKVYIVNKASHDYDDARRYGDLVPLSRGPLSKYKTTDMHRQFADVMKDSTARDFILVCSFNTMNAIAAAIFAHKHGRINLLVWNDVAEAYVKRTIVLDEG